jgi:hypothetical protein
MTDADSGEHMMDSELELLSDGDGLAIIGDPAAVERFLISEGLPSKDLALSRLGSAFGSASAAAQAGSHIAASSGRWVKLTKSSAENYKKYQAMKGSTAGVSRAVMMKNGKIKHLLEFENAKSFLTNPGAVSGVAGLMAQAAMQQTMDEILDYLAKIDAKVDDVLRNQKDKVLAEMIGVGWVIEDALKVREHVGLVSDVTWSKVNSTTTIIASTQAYALCQIDGIAESMDRKTKMGDLAKASQEAESIVREWLAVLARCFQLQDALAVLELDRVFDSTPEQLESHRLGVLAARKTRRETIALHTERLIARVDAAAGTANTKVLLHPSTSPAVVQSSNQVAVDVVDFHGRLGIERDRESLGAKRWVEAAVEVRDKVLESGADGVSAARIRGLATVDRARTVKGRVSSGVADRVRRRRSANEGDNASEGDTASNEQG